MIAQESSRKFLMIGVYSIHLHNISGFQT